MIREMVCIACPIGCSLSVELSGDGTEVLTVTGNKCKGGENYAKTECTAPTRTLTTTAKVSGGKYPLIPVRSAKPIPKGRILECMKLINSLEVKAPVNIGDILIENVFDTGINIIATNSCPAG